MVGTDTAPAGADMWASTMPMTALDTDVPIERIRVLRPLAALVSDGSTAPTIRAGSEEYARPMPAPTITEMITVCQAALIRPSPAPYPTAMTSMPSMRVALGPRRADIRAYTGAVSIIVRPSGATHRPATTIDCPRPYPVDAGSWRSCGRTREIA